MTRQSFSPGPMPSAARSCSVPSSSAGSNPVTYPAKSKFSSRPRPDARQPGTEVVLDHVVRVPDEHRPVPHAREPGALLDHLRVVVGGQRRLARTAVGHRQPADEVRHPREREPLELGVLVQEVVDVPRLVADHQVVAAVGHHLVEDHEVVDEDLVHPADRLERVQVVLAGLVLDVARLVAQPRRRGVDLLAVLREHPGDRVLREPVDLQLRSARPQLRGDRDVPLGVPEPDGRREVQRLRRLVAARTHVVLAPRRLEAVDELRDQVVDLHRVARRRAVPGVLEQHQLPAGELGQPLAERGRPDAVLGAVHHDDRARHLPGQRRDRLAHRTVAPEPPRRGVREDLRRDLVRPPDAVLDLLGRVRLGEHLPEEELGEVVVAAAQPVVLVVLGPALGGVQRLVPRHVVAAGRGHVEAARRGDRHDPEHPVAGPPPRRAPPTTPRTTR